MNKRNSGAYGGYASGYSGSGGAGSGKQKRTGQNLNMNRNSARQFSLSSFAPSNFYSHAATGSTFIESELTDVFEYRRRTLSRCNLSIRSSATHDTLRDGSFSAVAAAIEQTKSPLLKVASSAHTKHTLQIPNTSNGPRRRSLARSFKKHSFEYGVSTQAARQLLIETNEQSVGSNSKDDENALTPESAPSENIETTLSHANNQK
jgi:hypothetical protein